MTGYISDGVFGTLFYGYFNTPVLADYHLCSSGKVVTD